MKTQNLPGVTQHLTDPMGSSILNSAFITDP